MRIRRLIHKECLWAVAALGARGADLGGGGAAARGGGLGTRGRGGDEALAAFPDRTIPSELATAEGLTAFPALVLEDGTLIPGYQPAAELARLLGVN